MLTRCVFLSLILALVAVVSSPMRISHVSELTEAPSISFAASGDVLLDRGIARKIRANGMAWPFAKVGDTIREADLAFCNLECPLSAHGHKVSKPICFKAPPGNLKCVSDAGFDIVSTANNHALDCSRPGLVDTIGYLDKAGIAHSGSGRNLEEATAPRVMNIGGVRVAFLARNMLFPEVVWYRTDVPTIAELDRSKIEDEIRAAKAKSDVVVVSVHWGIEYRKHPTEAQKELARRMIDAGASLVLGHHPHVTQPVERYHGGVIAYSLGNFLFDSNNPKCMDSMILKCRLSRNGVSDLEIVPVTMRDWRPFLEKKT